MASLTLALLAFWVAPALAIETHPFTGTSIGPEGKTAPGAFLYLQAVEVDHSTGDIYVLAANREIGGSGLYRFDSSGEPLDFKATGTNRITGFASSSGPLANQIAIAPVGSLAGTGGDIYLATGNKIIIFSPDGNQIGAIRAKNEEEGSSSGQYCGVATDPVGNVYVKTIDFFKPIVTKLTPSVNPVTKADETGHSIGIPNTCRVALDGNGEIYAAHFGVGSKGPLFRLPDLSSPSAEELDPFANTVAVEPGTNDFYAGRSTEIRQYTKDGSPVSAFGEGVLSQVEGLAVAGPAGDVYVADNAGPINDETSRIEVFGPLADLPKAVAKPTTAIAKTSAVLQGAISADGGPAATCEFKYTTAGDFQRSNEEQRLTVTAGGGTYTLSLVGPGGGPAQTTAPIAFNATAETVQEALNALPNIPGYVIVAGGPGNKTGSFPYTISFHGAAAAQNVEQISVDPAKLTETQGPGAEVETLIDGHIGGFEGAESAPCVPAGPFTGQPTEAVGAEISGLTPGTKYFYRLVGSNENGSLGSNENGSAPGKVPSFETVTAFAVHSGSPTNLNTTSVTLNGSINPEGVSVNECFFEYGPTSAYGSIAPCAEPTGAEIGSGNSPVAVHAKLEGLTPNTKYQSRLVGGSAEFGGIHVPGANIAFETLGPPRVLSQALSEIDQHGVTVSGSIHPGGQPTTYFVEYVAAAAFAESEYATASRFPLEAVAIGSGQVAVDVSQRLDGLPPGSSYHVRLAASNAIGSVVGPDQIFRTQVATPVFGPCPANEAFRVGWSSALPDCRAYEQASPPDKNGDSVAGQSPVMFAAEDGSAATFYSPAATLPPTETGGTQTYATYLARRSSSAGSWSSQRLLPPEEIGEKAEYLGSSPDLRYAVVEAGPVEDAGLFLIDTETGALTQMVPNVPAPPGSLAFGVDGISADASRIFFESTLAISTAPGGPAPVAGHRNLFVWERSTGDVSLVGVLPADEGGGALPAGSFGGAYEWYEGEDTSSGGSLNLLSGRTLEPLAVAGLHAMPASGEQIFFTSAGSGQLYLRRGIGGSDPTTTYISTPNPGVGTTPGKQPAAFQEATPDGTRAFFISRQKLTADANTGPKEEGRDLYRWDASAPASTALTDITPDLKDPNGAEVEGVLGVSPSGTSGYFLARGVLASGGEIGKRNLYRFTEKAKGGFRITYIATLAEVSNPLEPDRLNVSPKVSFNYPGRTSRLSADGSTLLFTSAASLTGYDNTNPEGISCKESRCPELYLYSAPTEKLTCISCDPTGATPTGAATLQDVLFNSYFTPDLAPTVSFSRNVSADGSRVFFQTSDPLVAADENGRVRCPAAGGQAGNHNLSGPGHCQDVYEWEAAGSGSCQTAEANGGCLYLLSTGQSPQASHFAAASTDGSSAFIATDSQLVESDRDQVSDLYDVRVGGGLASQHVPPQPPCGSAEACKGPSSSPGPAGSPATSLFQGSGNEKARGCKTGFVRKHGKCVKKPRRHRKHRHHKGSQHSKKRSTGKKHSGGAK